MVRPEGEVRLVHSGSLPFAVDLLLGTYEGLALVRRSLRGKSGWLQVGRASMETFWGRWRATLVVAVTDKGEHLPKSLAQALLDMQSANPREAGIAPDEDFDGHMELAYWDFLGRCDLRHLRMLDEAEAELARRLAAEEARGEAVLSEVEAYVAQLHRRRRLESSSEARDAILSRIALLEQKHEEAGAWLIRHMADMRQEFEQHEADILAMLQGHGELEILQTVHWTARHPSDRHEPIQQASSLWPRDGVDEDWRGSTGKAFALSQALQLGRLHAKVPAEFYRQERLERKRSRANLNAPQPGEDALEKLARTSRAWMRDEEERRARLALATPRLPALDRRTNAQRKSAQRRNALDQRDKEISALIERFPTIVALDAELDRHVGGTGQSRRTARLLRHAIKLLSVSSRSAASSARAGISFPGHALVATSNKPPVPSKAGDSIDIDALIENDLRDMFKDLS
ncbi:MAG: hypothetical protein ABS75_07980 [Pelagibacterium sp. SCN 63-23]|nr:MAG: hypothetical protein ABS75_07980 [Pelagibacterium sp. SCN 63-23]